MSDIIASRRAVSAAGRQRTPRGTSSISAASGGGGASGAGRFQSIHDARSSSGSDAAAAATARVRPYPAAPPRNAAGIATSAATATTKSRGRDCGTKSAASRTSAPTRRPDAATAATIARKSAPPFDESAPTTFSSTTIGAPRPSRSSARISSQNGQNVPLRAPLSPAPRPARERSWQWNDAQTRSGRPGSRAGESRATSSTTYGASSPKLRRYAAPFFGQTSLAKRQVHAGPRPRRAMPPPAKNS